MNNIIYVTGYGRSGNTFLQLALEKMYNQVIVSDHNHNSLYFVNRLGSQIVMPIRNPLDSVASFYTFQTYNKINTTLDKCLNHYIEYFTQVNKHKDKLCLLDFEEMTKNLEYVKNKIKNKYSLESNKNIDLKQIETDMASNYPMFFYNRSKAKPTERTKQEILTLSNYLEALDVWNNLYR